MLPEPYEVMTPVSTHDGKHRQNDKLKGIITDYERVSSRRESYRYHVMISPEIWNATGRRQTDRPTTLFFYSDEVTPLFSEIEFTIMEKRSPYLIRYKLHPSDPKTHEGIQFHRDDGNAKQAAQDFIRSNSYRSAIVISAEPTSDPRK